MPWSAPERWREVTPLCLREVTRVRIAISSLRRRVRRQPVGSRSEGPSMRIVWQW